MSLTPIKIPGKKRHQHSKNPDHVSNANKKVRRPPGRPFRLTEPLAPSLVRLSQRTSVQPQRPGTRHGHTLSFLESLPTEILQTIFLYCLNLDLPRASPLLGAKLSNEHIYLQSVLLVFSPSWEQRLSQVTRLLEHDTARESELLVSAGDPVLQSWLLRCRWATLERLKTAQSRWLSRNMVKPLPAVCSSPEQRSTQSSEGTRSHRGKFLSRWAGQFSDHLFIADLDFARALARDELAALNHNESAPVTELPEELNGLLHVHAKTLVPESLLLGPWTAEMEEHLYFLVRSRATIDWINTTAGEAAEHGLQIALNNGNALVHYLLLLLGAKDSR